MVIQIMLPSLIARWWIGPQTKWRLHPQSVSKRLHLTVNACGRAHRGPLCVCVCVFFLFFFVFFFFCCCCFSLCSGFRTDFREKSVLIYKNSNEVLNKLKSRQFRAFNLSTSDFSMLYSTLPHNLIKEKLNDLIEWTFHREDSLYLAYNVRNAFFTSEVHKNYTLWTCQKMCEALTFLLDNIYIRFGPKSFRPMGTNFAPLVADLFLFWYERDFMMSLSVENQSEIIEAFSWTKIFGWFIEYWQYLLRWFNQSNLHPPPPLP